MFHLTPDGPKRCTATIRSCRYGEHFESREESRVSFESTHPVVQSLRKESALLTPFEIAPLEESEGIEILEHFDQMNEILLASNPKARKESREFLIATINGEIMDDLPQDVKDNVRVSNGIRPSLMRAGYYVAATRENAKSIKANIGEGVVLDVMAGRGFFTKALREVGVKTIATDDNSWGISSHVETLDAIEAIDKYAKDIDYVMIAWAPLQSDLDHKILWHIRKNHPHLTIINVGESSGGCTGSDIFWEDAEEDLNYPYIHHETFASTHDYVAYLK